MGVELPDEMKSVRMIPAGGRLGHDIRGTAIPENPKAWAPMNPSESVRMDDDWRMIPGFFSEFIKIDDVFLQSLPLNVACGDMRLTAEANNEFETIHPVMPLWLLRGFPCTHFYVREYVEMRIAETRGFGENRKVRVYRI
jgi:hypothetical protein